MALSKQQREAIENYLQRKIKEKLAKYSRESSSMPFLTSLVQDEEKVAAYSFLQSLATTLGMSIYEEVSVILAKPHSEEARRNVDMNEGISPDQSATIGEIIAGLRNGTRKANKDKEIKEVLAASKEGKKKQKEGKIADFYLKRNGVEYYFEIKTVKPNIDVFTASKRKLLEWVARKARPIETIVAFPYNPYYPQPYERFTEQGVLEKPRELKVAEEYWDFLSGKGTYLEILKIFDSVGKEFKSQIEAKMRELAKRQKLP